VELDVVSSASEEVLNCRGVDARLGLAPELRGCNFDRGQVT
jgi:hypothetical protein